MKAWVVFILNFCSKLLNLNGLRVCRFEPSCTCYAQQAVQAHALPRALWLIARRLFRCRPFGPGGYDPVPVSQSGL